MKKKLKIASGVAGVLCLIGAIGIGVLWYKKDAIIETQVERILSDVLEVEVTIDSLFLRPVSQSVGIKGFTIGNPDGFDTEYAIKIKDILVKVDLLSFRTDSPTINLISVDGAKINVEQDLHKFNIRQLAKNSSTEKPDADPEPEVTEKSLAIDLIKLSEANVSYNYPSLKVKNLGLTLDAIEIKSIGRKKMTVLAGELFYKLFIEIIEATGAKVVDLVPGEVKDILVSTGGLVGGGASAATGVAVDATKAVGGGVAGAADTSIDAAKAVGGGAADTAGKSAGAVKDAAAGAAKGIKGLFKKDKNEK